MRAVHWTVWDDAAAQRVRQCASGFVVLSGVAIGSEIVVGGPMPLGWPPGQSRRGAGTHHPR